MGGKKGGGSSHTPVEAKETGRSFQIARMLEVISEGEIHGLVDDMSSVYLDKTPLQNKDGTFNFKNVSVYATSGTQDQDPLSEFTSVEKEIDVNTKVLKDKPIIKTVTDVNVNRIRMTLGVERLLRQEDNGDTNPTTVSMFIEVLKNNKVVESRTYEFNGKYSSAYREMFDLTVPKPPFSIRVSRVQEDSTTNKVQNNCFWSSYTEIIDKEFAYPNTALVGIKIDSEYFNNIPVRNYEIYGLIVKVPSNYDAFNHRYTSNFWDGSFKLSWTNNPAWIFYDLVTNTRYGMGQRLGEFAIDKWQLYAIGRYCDELVPDGFGGTEPRMTCNIWITDQRKAYELINDITSIFRAMPVWNGQALTAIQDRASDPVWTYNNANVMGGFTRQRSAKKARHNVIQVEYIDGDDFYEKKIESVSDDVLVARYGQNVKKVTAFGCTSRGQAYRTGRWILETEKLETETITFTVGQEGVMHLPYDIIEVADSQYAGLDIGGRVLAVNGTKVTLDRAIEIDDESYLSYVSSAGITENVKIISFDNTTNTVTIAKSLNSLPELTVWGLSTKRIARSLYRAISIKENDNADGKTYTITALQHVPEKEDIVVNGTHFDPKPRSIYGDVVDAEITYNGSKLTVSGKVNGSYNVLSSTQITSYTVKLLKDGALMYIEKGLKSPDINVDDLPNGSYTAEISSYNSKNQLLQTYTKTFTINKPPLVTGIEITGHLSSVILTWNFVDDTTQTEIWSSERDDIKTAELVERITGMYYSHSIGAKKVRYYWLRHKRGINVGNFDQIQGRKGESGVDIDEELKLLNAELSKNIIDELIDVALPARQLGMLKSVDNLNVNVYAGANNVVNSTDNTIYVWDGKKYIPSKQRLLAEAIEGVLQPHQLAQIPSTQIRGTLTSEQIQSLDATKLIGTINVARIPSIPTNKLTGVLTDAQVQSLSATKLIGNVPVAQIPNIPTTKLTGSVTDAQIATLNANKLTGTVSLDRLPSVPTTKLSGNITNAQIEAVSASKIDGRLNLTNIPPIPTTQLTGTVGANLIQANAIGTNHLGANVITSEKINAGAVNARAIATDAIQAQHISANAITAVKIATNSVTSDKILASSVTTDKIATNAITAIKIQSNAITSDKIEANAITASKIRANAIESDKIKAGAIIAGKLATNAVLANNIQAGAINADKLETGSVGTRALQALAITSDKIQAGAITSTKIQANAINAQHISAGEISADKLAIGLGGNLLQNPIFANEAYGWHRYENTSIGLQANNNVAINNATGIFQGNEYLPTENQYRWQPNFTTYPTSETRFGGIYQDVKLVAGSWYILSGYIGSHRGVVGVNIETRQDGLKISNVTRNYTGNGMDGSYNQGLKDTNRIWIKFKVTANGTARCIFNQYILGNQTSAPFTVLRRPMLEECTEHTRSPSAWQNAGVTSIHGGSIVTNTITAQQIKVGTITANEIAGNTITANKIAGRTITADKIVAGTLTNNEIRTRTITADRLIINELSALTSNIGTITAGKITGTTITGNTITGGTINGTEIYGSTIRGGKFIGATGDFSGTIQVSSTLGTQVGSYSQQTNFKLMGVSQDDQTSCYDDSNNGRNQVCTGYVWYTARWLSTNTFTIESQSEETVLLPPNLGNIKSITPTANGLLGSSGKVMRSGTTYTVVVEKEILKTATSSSDVRRPPAVETITMKRHKRF